MEKATFIKIARGKKGKMHGEILFEKGKTMPIPQGTKFLTEAMQDQPCEVLREKGVITRIVFEGKEIYSKDTGYSSRGEPKYAKKQNVPKQGQRDHKKKDFSQSTSGKKQSGFAWAPYNFIPLNKTIVEGQAPARFDSYKKNRHTGYIRCNLEALTPLYLRDTYTPEELSKKEQGEDNPDFFSPGNRIKIPGSSLRGMVRNLVEIISWSKFGFFEDKLLFYRGLADKNADFRKEYQRNMSSYQERKTTYKFNAGYLQRQGLEYFIIPARIENGKQFVQVKKQSRNKEFVFEKQLNGKYLVISGNMQGKKRDWLINPPDSPTKRIPVPEKDVLAYNMDDNRYEDKNKRHDGNLMRMLSSFSEGMVPCFYVTWKDAQGKERVSFGHTGYFRLAYNYTIGDYLPESHKKESIDFAQSIFGSADKKFSTRVYFEDAELMPNQQNVVFEKASVPQILSGPKPTTFQHYLEADDGKPCHWNIRKYNDTITIRGNKLYWHRNNPNWEMGKKEQDKGKKKENKNIITQMRPIKKGTLFEFKIRYENLTDEELGLLLFTLDLPQGHCYKLGMGKPLGLGSVKITPTLYVDSRKERYSKLFQAEEWFLDEKVSDGEIYKKAFEKYLLNKLKQQEGIKENSLWDIERMRYLKIMLSWDNTKIPDWLDKTKYMQIEPDNDFKNRMILPSPEVVINS